MAFAPLSQIVILTEDGSIVPATLQVPIPPSVSVPPPTIAYGLSFDGPATDGTTPPPTPRAFFSDPFFSDPFFRTGA